MGIMEKANVKSKSARALGMISGIAAMGIIGGSAIANAISNKVVNPLFGEKQKKDLEQLILDCIRMILQQLLLCLGLNGLNLHYQ